MNKIKYSIIIPHKNIPQLLERCLKSIPEDDSIQVIVVDDCSEDQKSLRQVINSLKRRNVECYYLEKSGGAGYARNMGLRYLRGKWTLFADADDFFANNFVESLDKYFNSESEIIFFSSLSVDSDSLSPIESRVTIVDEFIARDLVDRLRYCYYVPWAKMIRSSLIINKKILFDESYVCNDAMFSIRTGHYATTIDASTDKIYVSTMRKDSLFFKISEERLEERYNILMKRINKQLIEWGKWKYRHNTFQALNMFKKISNNCYKKHLLNALYEEQKMWLFFDFIVYYAKKALGKKV